MRPIRILSTLTAVFAAALVALSPIVRITGSGMGCGDHWPLCNGRLIPPLDDLPVMIEWGHRLAAAAVSVLLAAVLLAVVRRRDATGVGGPGGVVGPAAVAVLLLVAQILLGALTVWLELPPVAVVVHMANALALLAAVLVATFRAYALGAEPPPTASPKTGRSANAAIGMGAAALLLGALTANLHAGMACAGFPLCSGTLWPSGGGLALLHWAHRLVAYALGLHVVGILVATRRRAEPSRVRAAAWLVAGVMAIHVTVAAVMVFQRLPMPLRLAHTVLGTLLWVALVYNGWVSGSVRGDGAPAVAPVERSATSAGSDPSGASSG